MTSAVPALLQIPLLRWGRNPPHSTALRTGCRAGTEGLGLANSQPTPFCHIPTLLPSAAKAISMASCTAPTVNSPRGKRWQRASGVETLSCSWRSRADQRGLSFSPSVKHVDLLIDGRMTLTKIPADRRVPLRAARSLGEGKAAGSVSSYPLSPSESRCHLKERVWSSLSLEEAGHWSTGLQAEARHVLPLFRHQKV